MSRRFAVIILVLVTIIWGSTFVVVKETVVTVPLFLLLAVRFSVGALLLLPAGLDRRSLRSGLLLGGLLLVSFASQTKGLSTTGASRAAFITGLSVVIVPILSALRSHGAGRTHSSRRIWLAAGIATLGLGLLTFDLAPPNRGDAWVLVCAAAYALYILNLEAAVKGIPVLRVTFSQLAAVALASWLLAIPNLPMLPSLPGRSWLSLLYLGIVATALSTYLQGKAQRVLSGEQAAIIFTLEPVFAALFAWLTLGERLGLRGIAGGAAILAAMLIALPRAPQESLRCHRVPQP